MEKTKYVVINHRTGNERPVAANRVLDPLGEQRMDGWSNVVTGLGTSMDKRTAAQVHWQPMSMEEYEQAYSGDDQFARICDIIPNDATREWLSITGKDPKTQEQIPNAIREACKKRLTQIDARGSCERVWKWARAFGGALQYIVTDCTDPSQPLQVGKERVLRLQELSRYDIRILTTDVESDFGSENYGRPRIYYLNVQMGSMVKLYPVHWTRMIRYDGKLVPRRTYIRNNYWHDSELQRLFNVIRNYQTSNDAAAAVLQDFNVGKFKMKDLQNLMQSDEGEATVMKRIAMINHVKSTIRAVLLDADSEDFEDSSRNVTGLPEMLDHQARRYVAATDIPHTKMLGESPDGSNATGNSTMQLWHQFVRAEQNNYLRPKLERLFSILFYDIEGLDFKFNKLHHLSEKEEADLRYTNAQADSLYIQEQVLDPTEVARSRFGGEEYGEQIQLDMEARQQGFIGQVHQAPTMGEEPEEGEEGDGDEKAPPPGGKPGGAKKDADEGDFPPEEEELAEGEEADEQAGDLAGGLPGGAEPYNPWEDEGEETEEVQLPESLQDQPVNPEGAEVSREGDVGKWSLQNNEIPSKTEKAKPFVSQTESLPFRDPKTDPKMPPPGRKPPRQADVTGKYSAAGGSQKVATGGQQGGKQSPNGNPSVGNRKDSGESSLMPRALDSIKGRKDSEAPRNAKQKIFGTSVVVECEGKVLLGKRRDTGKWALPGGCCEPGETTKLTARRELWEETGLRSTRLLPMKQHDVGHAMVTTFRCQLPSPLAAHQLDPSKDPDHEFVELQWVDVSEGLPAEIAGNLHYTPDLALLDVGLGKSST